MISFTEEAKRIRALRIAEQFEDATRRENALLDDLGYQRYLLERRESGLATLNPSLESELASVFGFPSIAFRTFEELAAVEEDVRRALGVLYVEENSDGRRVVVYRPRVDDFMQMMYLRGTPLLASFLKQGENEWEVAIFIIYEDAVQFAWRQGAQYWTFVLDDEQIGDGCHLIYVDGNEVKYGLEKDAPIFTFGRARGEIANATLVRKLPPAAVMRYEDGSWHVFHTTLRVGLGVPNTYATLDWHFGIEDRIEIVGAKALTEDK